MRGGQREEPTQAGERSREDGGRDGRRGHKPMTTEAPEAERGGRDPSLAGVWPCPHLDLDFGPQNGKRTNFCYLKPPVWCCDTTHRKLTRELGLGLSERKPPGC